MLALRIISRRAARSVPWRSPPPSALPASWRIAAPRLCSARFCTAEAAEEAPKKSKKELLAEKIAARKAAKAAEEGVEEGAADEGGENVKLEDVPALEIPPPEGAKEIDPDVERLANEIVAMDLLKVADLVDLLKDKLGLGDIVMGVGGGGGGDGGAAAEEVVEEQTEFAVKLKGFEPKGKIKLIKEIRALAGLGLKEAKTLVESAPVVVKKDLGKEEAEALAKKLQELGGDTELE